MVCSKTAAKLLSLVRPSAQSTEVQSSKSMCCSIDLHEAHAVCAESQQSCLRFSAAHSHMLYMHINMLAQLKSSQRNHSTPFYHQSFAQLSLSYAEPALYREDSSSSRTPAQAYDDRPARARGSYTGNDDEPATLPDPPAALRQDPAPPSAQAPGMFFVSLYPRIWVLRLPSAMLHM